MKIIIFGPQGSGKGTQADILAERLNICHITMGDLLRTEAKSGSELGQKINGFINDGQLVPDEIVLTLLKERVIMSDCGLGYILDGFPRNLDQIKLIGDVIKAEVALEIWISDEEAIRRIIDRRSCPKCGAVYHLKYHAPKTLGRCDKCQSELMIRDDDKEEVIKKRLNVYHQQTEPLIKYYQDQGIYIKINGMPSIPEVTKEIFAKLKLS
ncbi:MAG: nucleoside monophosphate kinase [Candidatus Komeilibacteria bacterium]|nr:nucleoside monophosphate kinase [Candidatus Komeilibacteria bacterium]